MNICSICGKKFSYPPALSREDNRSPVCRPCSALEALDAAGIRDEDKERVLAEIRSHENG